MERLSTYKDKVMSLFLDVALYQEIGINYKIKEVHEQEIVEDNHYTIYSTNFIESEDFQTLKNIFYSNINEFHYCPYCDKTLPIIFKGFTLDEVVKGSTLYSEDDINSEEMQDYANNYAKKIMDARYNHVKKQLFGDNGLLAIELECTSKSKHKFNSIFKFTENHGLMKIGQIPSVADFDNSKKRYKKVIKDKAIKEELGKAIGLKAHGVGVGSYVYLRRVFEKLIYQAFEIYMESNSDFNRKEFEIKQMDQKIQFLKDFLPKFLVDNKPLYKILSKGIHELTEDECLQYYDIVYESVIVILEEKLKNEERESRARELSKSMSTAHSNLSKKKD